MEKLRKAHNLVKRHLIHEVLEPIHAPHVLDVGCGRGGDLQKWKLCDATLHACDPDEPSLDEAKNRAEKLGYVVKFIHGDIFNCPLEKYDSICYNFSLHYIFENEKLFLESIEEIKKRLKVGGKLFGCIPDSEKILLYTPFNDSNGNFFSRNDNTGYGKFGEKLYVRLVNTPYYQNGAIPEPICYKDYLITYLERVGILLESWKPLNSPENISKLYSQFIFVNIYQT